MNNKGNEVTPKEPKVPLAKPTLPSEQLMQQTSSCKHSMHIISSICMMEQITKEN